MSRVEWRTSEALLRRLRAMEDATRPGSKVQNKFRGDVNRIITEDHTDKMLRGVDGRGRPRAPLAASTLANPRRGGGPSLVPRNQLSRFITGFRTAWTTSNGGQVLRAWFEGMPWAIYHLTGCPKGSNPKRPNWSLPKRDVSGITPKGWQNLGVRLAALAGDIRRMGGGR